MHTKQKGTSKEHSRQQNLPQPVLIEPPGSTLVDHKLDGKGLRFAIISTRWYDKEVIQPLVKGCKEELLSKGVLENDIDEYQVPGAYEMPFVASRLIKIKSKKQKKQQLTHRDKSCPHEVDAVICIGCMVKGGTMAYEFVSEAATMGLMKLNVMSDTPVVLGLLTCQNFEQAERCGASLGACVVSPDVPSKSQAKPICNHGVEWAQEAIELAHIKRSTAELLAMKISRAEQCNKDDCQCSCHCESCKCKSCTCTDCKCKSCYHGIQQPQQQGDRNMMQHFDNLGVSATTGTRSNTEPSLCAGCSKSAANCACRDCNCASCASKSSGRTGTIECRKCGKKHQDCVCEPMSSSSEP